MNKKISIKSICLTMGVIILLFVSFISIWLHLSFHNRLQSSLIASQQAIGTFIVDILELTTEKEAYRYYLLTKDARPHKSLFVSKDIKNAYILSYDGKVERVFKREDCFYIYPHIDIKNTLFFKKVKSLKGKFEMFPFMYSPFSNKIVSSFILKRDGYYLVIDIALKSLSKYFSQLHLYKNSILAISRFHGVIIFKSDPRAFPYVISRDREILTTEKGKKFIMIPVTSDALQEKMYVLIPYNEVYKPFYYIVNIGILLSILSLLFVAFIFIWQSKFIINPISRLSHVLSKSDIENPITLAMMPKVRYKELIDLENAFIKASKRLVEDSKKIKETSIYMETLLKYFPNGIIILKPDDMIVETVNDTLIHICNKKREEVVGHSLFEVFPALRDYSDDIKNGKRFKIRRDKKIYEVKASRIEKERFLRLLIQIDDVTEKELMEDKLRQIRRMETVNLLSRGFSHDFNNLLNTMSGYLELLIVTQDEEKKEEIVKKLRQVMENAETLVKKIQILSKAQRAEKEKLRVREFLLPAIMTMKERRSDIKFYIDIEDIMDEEIYGDYSLLTTAIMNILENAIDAVKEKDEPMIKITGRKREIDKRAFIAIAIEDNGVGMSKETRDKIYEPFFTLKGLGAKRGTGLGMTIVHSIIDLHDGIIEIDSEEGKGTKVSVFLPLKTD